MLPVLAGAIAGFVAGSAWAAEGPLPVLDGGAPSLAREVVFGGASLVDRVLGLGWAGGREGSSGAARAALDGIGIALLGLTAVVIIAVARLRTAAEHRRLDVVRRIVEQGLSVPPGLLVAPVHRDLRRGVVLLCLGAGLSVAGLILGDRGLGALGVVPAFVGVGYLIAVRLALGEGLAGRRDPEGPA